MKINTSLLLPVTVLVFLLSVLTKLILDLTTLDQKLLLDATISIIPSLILVTTVVSTPVILYLLYSQRKIRTITPKPNTSPQ